jgi:CBS domain-containing protein
VVAGVPVYFVGQAPGSIYRTAGEPFAGSFEVHRTGRVVQCPRRGAVAVEVCEDCPHLLSRTRDTLRCAFSGRDPVGDWMVPAPCLISAALQDSPADAARRLAAAGSEQLLVLDEDRLLVGVLSANELARCPGPTLRACVPRDLYVTGPATSLSEAMAAMRALGVSALPVVDGPLVLGLVTRQGLLRRAIKNASPAKPSAGGRAATRGPSPRATTLRTRPR